MRRDAIRFSGLTVDKDDYLTVCELLRSHDPFSVLRELKIRENDRDRRVYRLVVPGNSFRGLPLPASIGLLTGLEKLNLKGITSLPPSIDRLQSLKYLNLSDTSQLLRLPAEIGNLTNLAELVLCSSRLKSLPDTIGRLQHLQKLDLSYTRALSQLPHEIGHLVSLEELDLHYSEISFLPSTIGNLTNLKSLYLSSTEKISTLPETIGNLVRLKVLYLSYSNIASLPDSFENLNSLVFLCLYGTKIPQLQGGNSPTLTAFLLNLVRRSKSLAHLGSLESDNPRVGYELACKRAKLRMGIGSLDREYSEVLPHLWPLLLNDTRRLFRAFRDISRIYSLYPIEISAEDASYELLSIGREPFLRLLIERAGKVSRKRKIGVPKEPSDRNGMAPSF